MSTASLQRAPDELEIVQAFLNTWRIPHDTRVPVDTIGSLAAMQQAHQSWFGAAASNVEHRLVPERALQLRADLRGILGTDDRLLLDAWLARQPIVVRLSQIAADSPALCYRPIGEQGCVLCGAILALVVDAIARGRWLRLKACPDCQWVFYDHTRNASKVWCCMTASGPAGRSCGSIAKVRSFRERQRAAPSGRHA